MKMQAAFRGNRAANGGAIALAMRPIAGSGGTFAGAALESSLLRGVLVEDNQAAECGGGVHTLGLVRLKLSNGTALRGNAAGISGGRPRRERVRRVRGARV